MPLCPLPGILQPERRAVVACHRSGTIRLGEAVIIQGFTLIICVLTLMFCGFTLWVAGFLTLTIGRLIVSTQESVDAIVVQLGKAKDEVVAKIADVQAQLDAASVPAEVVNLDALNAAAQALDDIVADDVPPVS